MNCKNFIIALMISFTLFSCSQDKRRIAEDLCEEGIQKMYDLDYSEAIKDFNKSIEADSTYAKSYYHRAGLLYARKKVKEAIIDYSKAIELDTNFADAYYSRGLVYFNNNQTFYACQDWLKAYKLGKPNIEDKLGWCK